MLEGEGYAKTAAIAFVIVGFAGILNG